MATATASSTQASGRATEDGGLPAAARAAFDVMLVDAAVSNTGPARVLGPGTALKLAGGLARRPTSVARAGSAAWAESYANIVVGGSTVAPSKRDKRFADPAWSENSALRRLVQAYLTAAACAEGLAQDGRWSGRTPSGCASPCRPGGGAVPQQQPLTNPVAWKASDRHRRHERRAGSRNAVSDLATAPRIPKMVDTSGFALGENLAPSGRGRLPNAGLRAPPVHAHDRERPDEPLLIVPPSINKYYVLDLSPDRSMIAHLVASGQQVFVMSWRNPDARHSQLDLDVYVQSILDAMAAAQRHRQTRTHLMAACSGGILASMASSYLAERGLDELASLTLP